MGAKKRVISGFEFAVRSYSMPFDSGHYQMIDVANWVSDAIDGGWEVVAMTAAQHSVLVVYKRKVVSTKKSERTP